MRFAMGLGAGILGIAAMSASPASAQDGWRVIAVQTVSKGGDQDTVFVTNREKFSQVRICVFERRIHLNDFSVQFGNGGRQSLDVKSNFRPGQCSRAIDLKGDRRHIELVMLNYRRLPGDGAPVVRIQAR